VDGGDLMLKLKAQAERFGARVRYLSLVEKVDLSKRPFELTVDGDPMTCKALIVATGAGPQRLNVPGESDLESRGITFCAICDGALPFFRNKPLVVVGGGDSACEEALYLTRFGSVVNLVHRRDQLRASKVTVDHVLSNPKIKVTWNAIVLEVLGKEKGFVSGLRLKDTKTGAESILEASGLFVAIGHIPNTKLFKGQLDMDDVGFLKLHDGSKTNIEGVFGAGDCADRVYRQAITAAGMGCAAAIDAERYLAAEGV